MRSRSRSRRRAMVGIVLALAVVVIGASLLIPDYGDNRAEAGSMPPQVVNRIAQKNQNAAITAAADMRARSAREARLADQLQDQQDANAARPAR